jgi:hypothetical protein
VEAKSTHIKSTSRRWNRRAPEYRRLWEERYGTWGERWEDVEPGYCYGDEMASDSRYEGKSWDAIAPLLESDLPAWAAAHGYEALGGANLWERLRRSIRHAWQRARYNAG